MACKWWGWGGGEGPLLGFKDTESLFESRYEEEEGTTDGTWGRGEEIYRRSIRNVGGSMMVCAPPPSKNQPKE